MGLCFPRVMCRNHPGCPRRNECWYSHGLVRSLAAYDPKNGPPLCFLGQAPHNQSCRNPARDGEVYEFCSKECRHKASFTRKGPLGCRRADCPCPVTINGLAGQFCCESCMQGTPCPGPSHVRPGAHLIVVAKVESGKYQPCARAGCACAAEGGSSWDGSAGQFCCKACRNGTPCTELWHTLPLQEAMAFHRKRYTGAVCIMEDCSEAVPSGQEGEYCCEAHRERDKALKAASPELKALAQTILPGSFPDYISLWPEADGWARRFGSVCTRGPVTGFWVNECLSCPTCPSRVGFEKAVRTTQIKSWTEGEFAFHGTRSILGVRAICWGNLDTGRRSGQALGPGEYFTRGQGMHISESYAGGDAANLMIVFWIIASKYGAAPYGFDGVSKNPNPQWMCATQPNPPYASWPLSGGTPHQENGLNTGIIVVNNPVTPGTRNQSTGEMYCIPLGVIGFGGASKPNFPTSPPC